MKPDCWHYLGSKTAFGYGIIAGRLVHRLAYEMWVGPLRGKCSLHKCDYPPCFNPKHLFAGTQADNMRDAWRKGRIPLGWSGGEIHGNHKLTSKIVRKIRRSYRRYVCTAPMLAKRYRVGEQCIWKILQGETWAHVKICGRE